ncbi:MAG: hypothetical protein O3B87_03125 [bacterium]|nr:hypothetical protein [bacterium]
MGKRAVGIITSMMFILILGVILFINYYPHYYGLQNTPERYSYSGQASWFDPWDINNYFATIKLAQKEKSLLLSNINTTEQIKPTFIYPLYTISAILFPKINTILLYHVLAIVCGILLATGILLLSKLLLKKSLHSLYALLIISLGGGLGFLFSPLGMSADLSIPGVTFLSTFQKPHEAIAALLYTSSLVFYYLSIEKKTKKHLFASVATFLLLIPIYPYRLLSFLLIAGLFTLFTYIKINKKYPFIYLGLFSLLIIPPTILYTWHFLTSGFSELTSYQPQPISLVSLVLGYGLFIMLFVYQLFLPKKSSLVWFLNIWIMVSLILSLLPFGISRLYLSGLLFPMAILFMLFLKEKINQSLIVTIFIMIISLTMFLPTSFYIFNKRIAEVENNSIWFYIPLSFKESFDFLERSEQDGVLALSPLSSYIPAQTGKHVYFGIKDQTPDYDNKVNNANAFYSGLLPESEAEVFIKENDIHFIVVSLQDGSTEPLSYSFLTVVYENKEIQILSPVGED